MKQTLIFLFSFVHLTMFGHGWENESFSKETNLKDLQFIDINHGWIVDDSGAIFTGSTDNG